MDKLRAILILVLNFVLLTVTARAKPTQEAVPGDRVVIEINSNVYTQRMLESYLVLRGALGSDRVVASIEITSEKNWENALQVFTEEMLVLQEAQRSGSFSASGKTIDAAIQMIDEALKNHPMAQSRIAILDVGASHKIRMVSWILKIEGFRRSKARQSQEDSTASSTGKKDGKSDWIKELQERAVVRLFEGASKYRPIAWPAGISK